MPKTLLPASNSNAAGFFESIAINRLNDKILRSVSANWRSWQSMPTDWDKVSNIQSLKKEAVATLEAEFDAAPFILLKDPRFCRLMRFWLPVLEASNRPPAIVCPIRNPLEVAASLERRNGLPKDLGLMIWLRYQLDAEYDTRGLARAFTNYNGLLADWRQVLGKITSETGLTALRISDRAAEELTTCLSPEFRHHQAHDATALHDESYPEWIRSAYAIFLKWSETHEDEKDHAQLDQIRNDFNTIPHSLQGILNTGHSYIEAAVGLRKKIEQLETEQEKSAQQMLKNNAAIEMANTSLQAVKSELVEAQQTQAQLQQLAGQKEAEAKLQGERNGALQKRLDSLTEHARELDQRLAQREAAVEMADASLEAVKSELARAQQTQAQLQQLAGQKEAEAKLQGERNDELQKRLDSLTEHVRELDQRLAQREAAIEMANASLEAVKSELVGAQQTQAQLQQQAGQKETEAKEAQNKINKLKQQLSEHYTDSYSRKLELEALAQKLEESKEKLASTVTELDLQQRKSAYFGRELDRMQSGTARKFQHAIATASRQLLLYFSLPLRQPDRDLILRIAGSMLFDRSWYLEQYTDVAAAQVEPAPHYLRFGAGEMRDPGPHFSTQFYLEKYPDVASSGINALVHYELFGRKEGREIGPSSRMLDLLAAGNVGAESMPSQNDGSEEITGSEYFDASWYLKQYPDVAAAQVEPALHYLHYGASEMRDPGPSFSTRFYLEEHPDVADSGINPLVHYELFGRNEGRDIKKEVREIVFSNQAEIVPGYVYSPALNPDKKAIQIDECQRVRWKRFSAISQPPEGLTIEFSGQRLGWLPIPEDHDKTIPTALVGNLAAFGHLMGLATAKSLSFLEGDSAAVYPAQIQTEDALDLSILAFPDSGLTIESAWYLNDQDMRLRFTSSPQGTSTPYVVRCFQYDPAHGGSLVLVGEHLLLGQGLAFVDIGLINAYLPILATLSQPDARLVSVTLLPYPSLCQGGAHFPELLATGDATNSMESLRDISWGLAQKHMSVLEGHTRWELGSIDVDLRGAISTERIFSRDFKEWLWAVMRTKLKVAANQSNPTDQAYWLEALSVSQGLRDECLGMRVDEREQSARLTMICPPNAIPSIHALVAGQVNGGLGSSCALRSFIVADAFSTEARWRVEMPSFVSEWQWAQPDGKAIGYPFIQPSQDTDDSVLTQEPDGHAPIAVLACDFRPPHPSTLILPVAPEISGPLITRETQGEIGQVNSIHCIYACEQYEQQEFSAFIESLRLQKDIELESILIALFPGQENFRQSIESVLQQLYPGRFRLVEVLGEKTGAEMQSLFNALLPDSGGVLWVNRNVLLHDPRTLETLWQIAQEDQVASAGCLLLRSDASDKSHPIHFVSAGTVPVTEQFSMDWQFREMNHLPVFSRATYPVAANSAAFHVARTDVWKSLVDAANSGHESTYADIDFFATALSHGYRHFCTTLVSAELREAPLERPWLPPEDLQAEAQATSVTFEALKP